MFVKYYLNLIWKGVYMSTNNINNYYYIYMNINTLLSRVSRGFSN